MNKYLYLLINIAVILVPMIMSFEKKLFFFNKWKFALPSILFIAVAFIIWDIIFTMNGVWSFNPAYIIGVYLFGLPIEELLFFIAVPFSCLFIYEVVKHHSSNKLPTLIIDIFSMALALSFILIATFNTHRTYTYVTFYTLGIIQGLLTLSKNRKPSELFYKTYIIILIPFIMTNGLLTYMPIVTYNNDLTLGFRLLSIPIEDVFYGMLLVLLNITLYDYFLSKSKNVEYIKTK